jgi:predicted nucleic acid-binding protein
VTVIDASAAVDLLLRTSPLAVEEAALGDPAGLRAPELLDLEVLSALRRAERGGELTGARLAQALDDLTSPFPSCFPFARWMARVAELRANVSPYRPRTSHWRSC